MLKCSRLLVAICLLAVSLASVECRSHSDVLRCINSYIVQSLCYEDQSPSQIRHASGVISKLSNLIAQQTVNADQSSIILIDSVSQKHDPIPRNSSHKQPSLFQTLSPMLLLNSMAVENKTNSNKCLFDLYSIKKCLLLNGCNQASMGSSVCMAQYSEGCQIEYYEVIGNY